MTDSNSNRKGGDMTDSTKDDRANRYQGTDPRPLLPTPDMVRETARAVIRILETHRLAGELTVMQCLALAALTTPDWTGLGLDGWRDPS